MTIAVLAEDDRWEELTKGVTGVDWQRITLLNENVPQADGYIILTETEISLLRNIYKPVLFNSVIHTLKEMNAPENFLRINGWNGFLSRQKWEAAGVVNAAVQELFSAMQKQIFIVADEPGMVAARPIAMIINEAYFALEQGVSTKNEIDTAMKLGTNYPFGPFEWASIIGLQNIFNLLRKLNLTDTRYTPSSLLKKEAGL